jgi:hypothetical protein
MFLRFLSILAFIGFISSCSNSSTADKTEKEYSWPFASFQKVDSANPVLTADSSLTFTDPILKHKVQWAAKDVFNPAAVVRHDTIFLLFRAEDEIGKYAGTSRIGLAWSTDGLHFRKIF